MIYPTIRQFNSVHAQQPFVAWRTPTRNANGAARGPSSCPVTELLFQMTPILSLTAPMSYINSLRKLKLDLRRPLQQFTPRSPLPIVFRGEAILNSWCDFIIVTSPPCPTSKHWPSHLHPCRQSCPCPILQGLILFANGNGPSPTLLNKSYCGDPVRSAAETTMG